LATRPTASQPASSHALPRIAVVIPILDEAATLDATLTSVAHQDYPHERFEVIIVDGRSSDHWRPIVDLHRAAGATIRVLSNAKATTPAAVNLAIAQTDADAILWISGHCVLSPNYLSASAPALMAEAARVTGGRLDVSGEGVRGQLNALVLSSRFGTGVSSFRFDRTPGPTGSITYSLFRRRTLLDVGGLDESLARNQDNDLVARLKEKGIEFWRVDAVATYLAPKTFAGLWRRAFRNGAWSIWGHSRGRGGHSWWHFMPMLMVGVGGILAILTLVHSKAASNALLGLAVLYGVLALVSAVATATPRRAFWAIPILPFLFLVHHLIYGLGSWSALVRPNPVPPRTPTNPA
jgi:glycosyltransferase involved in cell wall biosynthesis